MSSNTMQKLQMSGCPLHAAVSSRLGRKRTCSISPLLLLVVFAVPASSQDFSSNLQQRSATANPVIDQANAAIDAHDYEKALKLLTPLAAASPKDSHILYDLASVGAQAYMGVAKELMEKTNIQKHDVASA